MDYLYPASAAGTNISVPATTASGLYTLLDAALAGTSACFSTPPTGIDIKPEDGDIRVTFGPEITATPLLGRLIKQGEVYAVRNRPIANMKLVSTGASAVKCSVEVGIAKAGEQDFYSGGGGGGSSSSSGGGAQAADLEEYSNARGDFTATANNGTKTITLSAFLTNSPIGTTMTVANFVNGSIKKITNTGIVTTLPLTSLTWDNTTKVLTLSDMTGNFVASDVVEVVVVGPSNVTIETAGADAQSNTTNSLTVRARQYVFNGTTWDRIRSAITTVSATLTGMLNTLPWSIYHATPTTRTDGQGGPLESDTKGNTQVNINTLISGENQGKNRMMMTRPGTNTRITTATTTSPVSGTGILAKIIVEAVLTGTVTVYDNTAAAGTILTILPIGTPAGVYAFDSSFSTGCTVVTSAADRVVVTTDLN